MFDADPNARDRSGAVPALTSPPSPSRSALSSLALPAAAFALVAVVAACSDDPTAEGPAPAATATAPTEPPPGDPPPSSSGGSSSSSGGPTLSCYDDLGQKGVAYEKTQARGVVDAIYVKGKINDVLFAVEEQTKPATDPMACQFVQTLWALADVLKAHGIHRVGTLGSYCYRCCCAWSETNFCRGVSDPEPSCGSNGYSNHSWGRAIDLRYFFTDDGQKIDVNDPKQWVISTEATCKVARAKQTGTSKFLYDLACDIADKKVMSTVLTPNYNDAHRNHLHLDIGQKGPASGFTVRSSTPGDVDTGLHADACGG